MQIIYHVLFDCEVCRKKFSEPVYGMPDVVVDAELIQEATGIYRTCHWNQEHRNCAFCGERVLGGDLSLAYNNDKIRIHENYRDGYKRVQPGGKQLLHVHNQCLDNANPALEF